MLPLRALLHSILISFCVVGCVWSARARADNLDVSAATQPGPQIRGEIVITDRYGKQSRLDVQLASPPYASVKVYSTGDSVDSEFRVLAVRMGEHIAKLESGSLWRFPLVPDTSGTADVQFDGWGLTTAIRWNVSRDTGDRMRVHAVVSIPTAANGYPSNQGRLNGAWDAVFDGSYPIALKSELKAALNVRPAGSEATTVIWMPH